MPKIQKQNPYSTELGDLKAYLEYGIDPYDFQKRARALGRSCVPNE